MQSDRSALRIADILRQMIANAMRVNVASRARSDEDVALLRETAEARNRVAGIVRSQEKMDVYFGSECARMEVCAFKADSLRRSVSEMQIHVEGLLSDEAVLQTTLHGVSDHSRAVADIARLARLLAINGSVEAARADDTGRGFAVVAKEMHALSEQSSKRARLFDDFVIALMAQLCTMRDRVTGTHVPLGALDAASSTLVTTLAESRIQSAKARNAADGACKKMSAETAGLQSLLARLVEIEMQTVVAIRGSAENARIAQEALDFAVAGTGPLREGTRGTQ